MTPEQEKAFFDSLEKKYEWRKDLQEPVKATILHQEDFEYVLNALALHVPKSPERDILVRVLIKSHKDLFQLYLDLKEITEESDKNKNA